MPGTNPDPNPAPTMRALVFVLFLLCLTAVTLGWAARAQRLWKNGGKWAWFFAASQIGGLGMLILSRNGQSEAAHAWSWPFETVLFVWYLIGIPFFVAFFFGEILCRWAFLAGSRFRLFTNGLSGAKSGENPPPAGESGGVVPAQNKVFADAVRADGADGAGGLTRRALLSAAIHGTPAVFSLGSPAVAAWQLEQFRVRKMEVPLDGLPPALNGFTITHLSDTHVGRFTHGRVLSAIVEKTLELDSDLICFTGDLINFSLGDLPAGVEMLQALKSRYGLYACEGNHDLMHDAAGFHRGMEKASLRVLTRECATFRVGDQRVQILGLPWSAPRESVGRLSLERRAGMDAVESQVTEGAFPILLAHHPHAFDDIRKSRLVLSGHTHGGQFMLTPRFGCGPAFYRYWSGLHLRSGRALCVSNGVGNWFPVRMRAPAEIIQLTLRPAVG